MQARKTFGFERFRLRWLAAGAAAGLLTAVAGCAWVMSPPGMALERSIGLDWLFTMRGAAAPPSGVAIVAISTGTGPALSLPRAPHHWARTVHAELLERLVERNPDVIVFDLDFGRPKPLAEDAVFAQAITRANRVVLFERLAARTLRLGGAARDADSQVWIEQRQPPSEVLAAAARAVGPFALPKVGQAAYEFWAFKPSAGDAPTTPAIALQMKALAAYDEWLSVLRQARAIGVDDLPLSPGELAGPAGFEGLMTALRRMFRQDRALEQRVAQVLEQERRTTLRPGTETLLRALAALYAGPDCYVLNLYGPAGTFPSVPYEALLLEKTPRPPERAPALSGSVVFVGHSDTLDADQPDRYQTSFTGSDGIDLSGVEIMATAYANLLTRGAIRAGDAGVSTAAIVVFGIIVGALAWLLPATLAVLLAFLCTAAYAWAVQGCFNQANLWLPLTTPALVQLPVALLTGLLGQYLFQRRRQRHFAQAILNYVPDHVVRDLVDRRIDPRAGDRVVEGTCLASDMTGFAKLGEAMSAKELAGFMNQYFEALAAVFKRAGVDVMEFRADMIMCAWVAAEASQEDARRAIEAAREAKETIRRFADERGLPNLGPRVGMDRGSIFIGHSGGGGHYAYSLVGDPANTAARLESLNKHLGTQVLMSGSVAIEGMAGPFRPLGQFQLSGRSTPVSVVEVLEDTPEQTDLCLQFSLALAAFLEKDWSRAARLFEALTKRYAHDGPSRFYSMKSREFAGHPPSVADPVIIRMQDK